MGEVKYFPISNEPIPPIDLRKVTHREWKALFDVNQSEIEADETIAKATGLTVEQIGDLNFYDYRVLFKELMDKASKPIDETDPKN